MKKYRYITECPHCGQKHLRIYRAGFEDITPEPGMAVVMPGEFWCRRCKRTYSCWVTIFENKEILYKTE